MCLKLKNSNINYVKRFQKVTEILFIFSNNVIDSSTLLYYSKIVPIKSGDIEVQILSFLFSVPSGLRIKCTYVWMGLRTCTAPSTNSSHTIRHEPKFVGFLREHKENWIHRVSFARLRFVEN